MVLLGWCPLVLWEVPGNAHNDIVMMFFAVAALYAIHRGAWQWAFPLLALGVGVKFIMALLGPIFLVWLLFRKPRVDRRELLLSIAYGAALLGLIYLPFFVASHSLANTDALRNRYISSPASLTIAFLMQYTSLAHAMDLTRAMALTLYGVLYLVVLWRARGGFDELVRAAFWAILITLTIPTWWFWPWYVVWLVPIAALLAGRKHATIGLVFASSALLVYPIYYWRNVLLNGPDWYANQFVIVGAVFGPLALYLLGSSGLHLLTVEDRGETESGRLDAA
jgi:alpha-1,6-mannosyltransferase